MSRMGWAFLNMIPEGRIITLEYPNFYLMTVYTPNSGGELKRLDYRQQWDKDFLAYTNQLAAKAASLLRRFKCRAPRNRP